jgi:hypothetical protein
MGKDIRTRFTELETAYRDTQDLGRLPTIRPDGTVQVNPVSAVRGTADQVHTQDGPWPSTDGTIISFGLDEADRDHSKSRYSPAMWRNRRPVDDHIGRLNLVNVSKVVKMALPAPQGDDWPEVHRRSPPHRSRSRCRASMIRCAV